MKQATCKRCGCEGFAGDDPDAIAAEGETALVPDQYGDLLCDECAASTATSLDKLFELMRSGDDHEWRSAGLGFDVAGEQDWTSLPTFGGEQPEDTRLVWSWDAARLLVGSCAAELEIVDRWTDTDSISADHVRKFIPDADPAADYYLAVRYGDHREAIRQWGVDEPIFVADRGATIGLH